jgi:hypothetical protein
MNRIIVEPEHLYQLFATSPGGWTDGLWRVWNELMDWEHPLAGADPRTIVVAEVLEKCHAEAIRLLHAHCPEWLEQRRQELQATGRLYGYLDFTSSIADATASLSPCRVFPHGSLCDQPVVLPDECAPTMVLGFSQLENFSKDRRSIAMFRTNCIS